MKLSLTNQKYDKKLQKLHNEVRIIWLGDNLVQWVLDRAVKQKGLGLIPASKKNFFSISFYFIEYQLTTSYWYMID